MTVPAGAASLVAVRVAYAAVFALNVTCALQFAFDPAGYVAAYQLEGPGAEAAARGMGVAFLMWNATYPLFVARPSSHAALGAVVLVQQLIGCVGEAAILLSLPATGCEVLAASIVRFVVFDAAGLAAMGATFAWHRATCRRAGARPTGRP